MALLVFLVLVILGGKRPHIKSLLGKHVVITGGSTAIGFALAKKCVSEGAFVTLMNRTEENVRKACDALIKSMGGQSDRILLKVVDVSDAAAVSQAITESFRWRPIDILICNDGLAEADVVNVDDIDMVTKTSFWAHVYPVRAALPLMKRRSFEYPSSIVFMSSLSGLVSISESMCCLFTWLNDETESHTVF